MRNVKLITFFSIFLSIAVLIILGSVLFSVRHIATYGYTDEDGDLSVQIISASQIKKGSSIFFLDTAQIERNIEYSIPNIDVINIERIFPNRVVINCVKNDDFFTYFYNGLYYECDFSGKITSISQTRDTNRFLLKINGRPENEVGKYFMAQNTTEYTVLDEMRYSFKRFNYKNAQITELIEFVDMRREDYLYIRTSTGAAIEIIGSTDNLFNKLHLAVSTYSASDANKLNATIIISSGASSIDDKTPVEDYYQQYYS